MAPFNFNKYKDPKNYSKIEEEYNAISEKINEHSTARQKLQDTYKKEKTPANKTALDVSKEEAKALNREKKTLLKSSKGIFSESGAEIAKSGGPVSAYVAEKTPKINRLQRMGMKPAPGFKYVAPGGENMFTGVRISKGGIGLAALGIAAMSVYSGAKAASVPVQTKFSTPPENMGGLSSMSYDGSGNIQNGSRTLGATGDLVFGLNKMRRVSK